jgi:DNA-binding transcriptional MerR regulator
MNTILFDICIAIISSLGGINLKEIKKIFDKGSAEDVENLEISESIDIVSKKLEDSKEIIEVALLEMEKQKRLFEQMKKEAEISQQITSMNQEQVSALNELLESTLNRQEKKAFPKTILWNLFFCVLSAILGFALGKFL